MKIALIIVLIGCCTYIGYGFSKYYSNRKTFYLDLILLMDKLKLDIAFSKEKISNIISSYEPMSKNLKTLCQNFVNMLQQNQFNQDSLFENINILKNEEKNTIALFFQNAWSFWFGKSSKSHNFISKSNSTIQDFGREYVRQIWNNIYKTWIYRWCTFVFTFDIGVKYGNWNNF